MSPDTGYLSRFACMELVRPVWFFQISVKLHLVCGVLLGDRDHPGWIAGYVPHTNVASPLPSLGGCVGYLHLEDICIWMGVCFWSWWKRLMFITRHEPCRILRWRSREWESWADQHVKTFLLPRLRYHHLCMLLSRSSIYVCWDFEKLKNCIFSCPSSSIPTFVTDWLTDYHSGLHNLFQHSLHIT